ncbi:MAG TPA: M23 family metallopeptidase [Acidimicrobiales bacterium]|nr:M23 family metallopeptidase [Acidimicrobiales bacterium]
MGLSVATFVAVGTFVVAGAVPGAGAQIGTLPIPGSDPPPTTTTTTPRSTTTTAPLLPDITSPAPPDPVPTTAPPRPAPAKAAPAATPPPVNVPGNGAGDTGAIPGDAGPFPADLAALSRSVRRTGARNTTALVDALRVLETFGLTREDALRVGMGQFPVGGYANYSHDWWLPRFGPGWRLHQGTDIFAARGTPIRAPETGVIRWAAGGLGGIAAYVVQANGTYFYLAHLDRRPPGQRDGQAVQVGETVGYVGTSGNAAGGSPHLHFEYHPAVKFVTKGKGKKKTTVAVPLKVRPGTVLRAVDPKSFLDLSLDYARANVPNVVATYRASYDATQAAASSAATSSVGPLDAVAGATALGGVQAAAQLSAGETLARYPLAALAFLLMLVVGSLTPVLSPARASLPGQRRRRDQAAPLPPALAPPPEPEPDASATEAGVEPSGRRTRASRRSRRTGVAARARRPGRSQPAAVPRPPVSSREACPGADAATMTRASPNG